MPFCMHCGAKIPDSAKFCPECGKKTATYTPNAEDSFTSVPIPASGILALSRKFGPYANIDAEVIIDGVSNGVIRDGEKKEIKVPPGNHSVKVLLNGEIVTSRSIHIVADQTTNMVFTVHPDSRNRQTTSGQSMTTCPKCGGEVNYQTVTEAKGLGCGSFIGIIILSLLVGLLLSWVISVIIFVIGIVLITRNSNETVTYAVCQKCGHRFRSN